MCFLRENEERKDGKYLLNPVAMLVADWLYEVKKRRRRKEHLFCSYHSLVE
jgi:hypothetical protein